jgi:hypothetical protein
MVICSLSTILKVLHRSAGAVAQIIDISRLYGTPEFSQIQDDAYNFWSSDPCTDPFDSELTAQLEHKVGICILGQHYFINGTTSLSPKWDFTSSGPNKGNPEAFVVAAKAGDLPSPDSKSDVDWLRLNGTSGDLAKEVLRVYTRGGQPPSSVSISRSAAMTHD